MYRTYRLTITLRRWVVPLCIAAQVGVAILIIAHLASQNPINWFWLVIQCLIFTDAPLLAAILWFRPDLVFKRCLRADISKFPPDVYPDYDHYMSVLASPDKQIELVDATSRQPIRP